MNKIPNKSRVDLGLVTTSFGFIPTTPDPYSGIPGLSTVVTGTRKLIQVSRVVPTTIQFPVFPFMTDGSQAADVDRLVNGLSPLGRIIPVIMFDHDPHGDEEQQAGFVRTLANGFRWAGNNGLDEVSATAFEKWMSGRPRISDADLPYANNRLGKLIGQAKSEAAADGKIPTCVHMEYLRPNNTGGPGEFSSYTSLERAVPAIIRMNEIIGGDTAFLRLLDDSAHAKDSLLSLEDQGILIQLARDAGVLGISHASAPTNRGCLVEAGEWLTAWIEQRSKLGALKVLLTEVFHPDDQLLNPLRAPEIGFGENTFNGRNVVRVVADGLEFIQRQLNAQVLLGHLDAAA